MRTKFISLTIAWACFAMAGRLAVAQTWTTLTNAPPVGLASCLLLTDGGVMCQSEAAWYKLTPDSSGSYLNGTWSSLASFPKGYAPTDYASAVLADGRVVVVGGEYNFGDFVLTNMGAIYDPQTNIWKMLNPPSTGPANDFQCIGDAPAIVLADGRLLLGSKLFQDLAVLDPTTLKWTNVAATGKDELSNAEEGWTLLPDGSVLTLDVANAPASERFLFSGPKTGSWVSSGNTLQDLHTPSTSASLQAQNCPAYNPPGEMGPALLRPDGTVFAIGASGYTGIYTPPAAGSTAPGSWAQGPAMPAGLNVEDGPAALLPNGHVLFGGSPGEKGSGLQYFEFDGTTLNSVPAPAGAAGDAVFFTQLLVLPSGQVMFVDGSRTVQLYTPAALPSYKPGWAPTIGSVPANLNNATTYQISGTQFNGLSQGSAFGDEYQNSTNYPQVRITNNATGHVFYAATHDHSTMAVATGATPVSTNFDVPAAIEAGASTIQVIANGIPSAPVAVTIFTPNAATATTVTSSPNPAAGGQPVTFTSTTSSSGGVPAGSVTFTEGATVLAADVPVNGSGQASFTTTTLSGGSHVITATFRGAAGWAGSRGTAAPQIVYSVTITTAALPNGQVNVAYSATLAASGGTTPYSWQLVSGSLPNGLTLNSQTGQIGGVPTAAVTSTPLGFKVTDANGQTASVTLSLTVSPAALVITTAALPNGQVNVAYSATLAASGGTTPYSWQLVSGTLPNGLALNSQTGQIGGVPTAAVSGAALGFKLTDANGQTASVTLSLTVSPAALVITTAALPTGQVNVAYSATLAASGGTTPYSWQLVSGTLPNGLALNSQTGQIGGVPTAAVTSTPLGFKVTDANGQTASVTLSLTVSPAALIITTAALPNGQVNVAYSATLAASGGTTPYSWQLVSGSLPSGLALNSQTGQIGGVPTAAVASTPLGFKVTDANGQTASVTLSLTVSPAALVITTAALPNGQVNVGYSATLAASGGTTPYSWQLVSGTLPSGLALNSQTGQIGGLPTAAVSSTPLGFKVTDANAQTASVTLSLTVSPAALVITTAALPNGQVNVGYSATLAASGGTTPYSWQLVSGTLPSGLALNSQTGQIGGLPTAAVSSTPLGFKVTDANAQTASVTLSLTVSPAALVITTAALPNGQVNVGYSATLAASGGTTPYSWQLVSGTLPSGLTLNSQTGLIGGVPTAAVSGAALGFKLTDANGQTASVTLSLTVSPAALIITTAALPNGQVNVAYSAMLSAKGGTTPYSWQLVSGTLPNGLALNSQTGQIGGVPTAAVSGAVLGFKVTDANGQTASVTLSITIIPPPPLSITSTSLPTGQVNAPYSALLTAVGGTMPYTWSLNSRRLPGGLTLNPQTGEISGTPNGIVTNTAVTFVVTDSSMPSAQTASVSLSLTITAPGTGVVITTTSLPNGQVNVPYSATLSAKGGTSPYSWQVTSGTLPGGLTLNSQTGQISGTPTTAVASTALQFSVTDASKPMAQTASATLRLSILESSTPAGLKIITTSLPIGQVNVPYSAVLTAVGGRMPYTWTSSSRRLPGGLILNAQTGEITGTPSTETDTSVTFTVTDSSTPSGQTASTNLAVLITAAGLAQTVTSRGR